SKRDWSSDVCSSDLKYPLLFALFFLIQLLPKEVHLKAYLNFVYSFDSEVLVQMLQTLHVESLSQVQYGYQYVEVPIESVSAAPFVLFQLLFVGRLGHFVEQYSCLS